MKIRTVMHNRSTRLERILRVPQSPAEFENLYRLSRSGLPRKDAVALFNCANDMERLTDRIMRFISGPRKSLDDPIIFTALLAVRESLGPALSVMRERVERSRRARGKEKP